MDLKEILVPIVIFGTMAYMLRIWFDYRIRRALVEKGMVEDKIKYLYNRPESSVPGALKWGMVLIAVGLAIFIGQMLSVEQDAYTIALMALFGGIALVAYHFIAGSLIAKQKSDN